MPDFDVVIVGAGGAGMMCGLTAASRGRKVCLVDHSTKIGRKILISGGGRCNFTNIYAQPTNYLSRNPHFCKSALARYTPEDFIKLVRKHRISYHEKKLGQLFCDGTADSIVRMLVSECEAAGAQFFTGSKVTAVERDDSGFHLDLEGERLTCRSLVVATGGLSIPKIGATGWGYETARQFGLKLVDTFPALVGFDLSPTDLKRLADLSGVAFNSVVSCGSASFEENLLFTHTGISGPAVLQASLYWSNGKPLVIDVLPGVDLESLLMEKKHQGARALTKNVLAEFVPRRFAERFAKLYIQERPLSELSDQAIRDFASLLHGWKLVPARNFGYAKAEVTRGGVDTNELSSKTMECKRVPGLYFIGEVVDVTGQLGGYNFQWAWASGHVAGLFA